MSSSAFFLKILFFHTKKVIYVLCSGHLQKLAMRNLSFEISKLPLMLALRDHGLQTPLLSPYTLTVFSSR